MLRGDSRQLLILGIPTITLVFGLLFLRHRRRKRGTLHTDPGGITDRTLNQDFDVNETEVEPLQKPIEIEHLPLKDIHQVIALTDDKADDISSELNTSESDSFIKTTDIVLCEKSVVVVNDQCEGVSVSNEELFSRVEPTIACVEDLTEGISDESFASDREEGELTLSTITTDDSFIEPVDKPLEEDLCRTEELDEFVFHESRISPIESNDKTLHLEEGEILESANEQSSLPQASESPVVTTEEVPTNTEVAMKKGEQGELVDKLVNLELDSMTMSGNARKESSERDSANHSPSEVMLASPSISNFSDAHSEGSSDSGKGLSDVATSPSRTPAGGSSLAGDLALSLYEFVLPQNIVGRLIGRHGASLHEIRSSTGTHIFIKRHPETSNLKICAIEGTQQDIDKALAKIRQKFPIRRFPKLTLDKVSFVTLNIAPQLKLEDFHLQLVEGVNNDVVLSSLITAAHFFLQQPSHPSYNSLVALNTVMNTVYNSPEAPVLDPPIKDAVCAAPTMGGWYRAQIMTVDEENGTSYVRFLDYGGFLLLASSSLRQIRGDLLSLPFQAVECYLANVAPIDGETWSEEARMFVQSLTQGQILQAQIYDYAEDGTTPLVYLYSSYDKEVILINEELVARGYGTLVTPVSDKEE